MKSQERSLKEGGETARRGEMENSVSRGGGRGDGTLGWAEALRSICSFFFSSMERVRIGFRVEFRHMGNHGQGRGRGAKASTQGKDDKQVSSRDSVRFPLCLRSSGCIIAFPPWVARESNGEGGGGEGDLFIPMLGSK